MLAPSPPLLAHPPAMVLAAVCPPPILPLPLAMVLAAACTPPPHPPAMALAAACPSGGALAGLRTVSSTLSMRQVASVAAVMAFTFTRLGSHTNDRNVSTTPPVFTSTPKFCDGGEGDSYCESYCEGYCEVRASGGPHLQAQRLP